MSEVDKAFWDDAFKDDVDQLNVPDCILDADAADLRGGTALSFGSLVS